MLASEKFYLLLTAIKKKVNHISEIVECLDGKIVPIDQGYECYTCNGTNYKITTTRLQNQHKIRYVTCKNCGSKLKQEIINIELLEELNQSERDNL